MLKHLVKKIAIMIMCFLMVVVVLPMMNGCGQADEPGGQHPDSYINSSTPTETPTTQPADQSLLDTTNGVAPTTLITHRPPGGGDGPGGENPGGSGSGDKGANDVGSISLVSRGPAGEVDGSGGENPGGSGSGDKGEKGDKSDNDKQAEEKAVVVRTNHTGIMMTSDSVRPQVAAMKADTTKGEGDGPGGPTP